MPTHPNRSRFKDRVNPTSEQVLSAREGAGLTQDAAARLVFASKRNWQQWEYGERRMHPGLWLLFRLRTGQEKLSICE